MPKLVNSEKLTVNSLAFTLIELLVVISIIGILATLMIANLNSARARARDAERKSDLKNISTALRLYFNDNGVFPPASGPKAIPWGSPWTNSDGSTVYMQKVPNDPLYNQQDLSPKQYQYVLGSTGDTFTLSACMENASDPQGVPASGITCDSGTMFQVSQQ
jgi:type II secretion system protein G